MTDGVGIGHLVSELQRRGERLPYEVGAFVALEACEASLRTPVVVEPNDVRVSGEGKVSIAPEAQRGEPEQSAQSLVSMLAQLLVAAGPGVPPNLLRLVERGGPGDLQRVHDEIEASLIPLNRSASRRVLARLVRESSRPPPARGGGEAEPAQVDAALDELLGIAPQEPVTTAEPVATKPAAASEEITKPVTIPKEVIENLPPPPEPSSVEVKPSAPVAAEPQVEVGSLDDAILWPEIPVDELQLDKPAENALEFTDFPRSPEEVDTVDETLDEEQTLPGLQGRSSLRWVLGLTALAAIVAIAIMADRGVLSWPAGSSSESPTAAAAPASAGQTGVVRLQVDPPDAQLFMFVGRGPVRVSGLALGLPHEFVAFDNGHRPSRAFVPEGAFWTNTDGEPLYELAVQSEQVWEQVVLNLGAPRSTPQAAPVDAQTGTVRVLTTPPGLKVFRYLGVGDAHTIDALGVQSGHEFLLYHPERTPSRIVIGPSDWVAQGETQSVQLKVTLPPQ